MNGWSTLSNRNRTKTTNAAADGLSSSHCGRRKRCLALLDPVLYTTLYMIYTDNIDMTESITGDSTLDIRKS